MSEQMMAAKMVEKVTVRDLGVLYVRDMALRGLKHSTRAHVAHVVEVLCRYLGDLCVTEVNTEAIWRMLGEMRERYAPSTTRQFKTVLSCMFQLAVRQHMLQENPCHLVQLRQVEEIELEEQPEFWTAGQYEEFISAMVVLAQRRSNLWRYVVIFEIAFWTGLRRGEILGLRMCDVDCTQAVLHVRCNKNQFNELTTPKTRTSTRDVTMPERLILRLRRYIGQVKTARGQLLFDGCSVGSVSMAFRRYRQRLVPQLPPIHLHQLRHSHASLLMALQIPPRVIADRLGHSSTMMLDHIYGHVYSQIQQNVAARLDGAAAKC